MIIKKFSVVLAVVVLAVSFAGCTKKITKYSFGPAENTSSISQEYKDFLASQLENSGKAPKGLSYYGYSAKYNDEGGLVVEGFFRNNTGKPVKNISGNIEIKSIGADKKSYLTIAKADFTIPDENFGVLENSEARPWQLVYSSEYIINKINDLSAYMVDTDLKYDTESSLNRNTAASDAD